MAEKLSEKKAQNGQPLAVVNGLHLCSSFNPDREAERWVQRHADLIGDATVILLGLGCGYHALETAANTEQRVIVLEQRTELINWFYRNANRQFPHLAIWHIGEDKTGRKMERVFALLGKPYTVLTNPYSMQLDPEVYNPLRDLLLGREKRGFKEQLQHRPDLQKFFAEAAIDHPGHKYLMGFPVVKNRLEDAGFSREAEIWRALGELVV